MEVGLRNVKNYKENRQFTTFKQVYLELLRNNSVERRTCIYI